MVKGLKQTVDPQSADYLMFDNRHSQPLVDAAFLVPVSYTHLYYWVTTWGKGIVRFDPKAQDTDKMFGLQTVDNASSDSDTRKLHHILCMCRSLFGWFDYHESIGPQIQTG